MTFSADNVAEDGERLSDDDHDDYEELDNEVESKSRVSKVSVEESTRPGVPTPLKAARRRSTHRINDMAVKETQQVCLMAQRNGIVSFAQVIVFILYRYCF